MFIAVTLHSTVIKTLTVVLALVGFGQITFAQTQISFLHGETELQNQVNLWLEEIELDSIAIFQDPQNAHIMLYYASINGGEFELDPGMESQLGREKIATMLSLYLEWLEQEVQLRAKAYRNSGPYFYHDYSASGSHYDHDALPPTGFNRDNSAVTVAYLSAALLEKATDVLIKQAKDPMGWSEVIHEELAKKTKSLANKNTYNRATFWGSSLAAGLWTISLLTLGAETSFEHLSNLLIATTLTGAAAIFAYNDSEGSQWTRFMDSFRSSRNQGRILKALSQSIKETPVRQCRYLFM